MMRAVRALPDRDAAGQADDVGRLRHLRARKVAVARCSTWLASMWSSEQARERQINLHDLVQRYGLVEPAEARQVVFAQRQRSVRAEPAHSARQNR